MMVLDARKRWTVYAAMIARIVLASTLLLGACALILQPGLHTRFVGVIELFLGIVIAVGWKTRHAAGLALLGALATSIWAIPLRVAFTGSHTTALMTSVIASIFLLFFGQTDSIGDRSSISEHGRSSHSDLGSVGAVFRDADIEVTIRLENGSFRNLHKQRCIVTFHGLSGGTQKTGKEVWYASDDR